MLTVSPSRTYVVIQKGEDTEHLEIELPKGYVNNSDRAAWYLKYKTEFFNNWDDLVAVVALENYIESLGSVQIPTSSAGKPVVEPPEIGQSVTDLEEESEEYFEENDEV
jgi:hypothetical protein